ncbi:MAG TPA: class I SAM-dependent methyltransferase [Patescibacteria group bacterium]|nr:class I SAM-dependent methyltransferase [Patescibacteria group bacterium]
MKDYASINKKWWNDVTPVHAKSDLYNLPKFQKGKTSLQSTEIEELGNVRGKTMLHLLCHFGMDTLSWARKGATVTGVDLSDSSIKLAKKLARENDIPGKFICADVYELPSILDEKFDIVFASYGVLLWLKNIKKFAQIVNHYLKPGGKFYIVELHPFTNILSFDFKLYYKYFKKGPYVDDSEGTYTDWNENVKGVTYEWSYTMGDIINSLTREGLRIDFVHEFPYTMYDQFPGFMEKNKKGQYVLKDKKIQIPLLFSLQATKEDLKKQAQ